MGKGFAAVRAGSGFWVAGAALLGAFLASPTYAADMAVKAAPVVAPAQVPVWTGWNLGLSAGGRWADVTGTSLSFGGGPVPFPALARQNYDSATARLGAYTGYDWQIDPKWLVGVEGDFAWGDGKKHVNALQGIATNGGNYSEARLGWDAGIRGRLGYLWEPTWLLYVTGGVEWQHFSATDNCAVNTCGPGVVPLGGSPFLLTNATTLTGWTIGGGVEKMLPNKWLVRAEYRYADFGNWTTTFMGAPAIVKSFAVATNTALLGIAKKF
jgi:outer membrane immunogenic protein